MDFMKKHHLLIDCSFFYHLCSENLSIELYTGRLLQGFRNSEVFDVTVIVWKGFESRINNLAGYEVPKIIIDGHHHVTPWPIVDRILGLIPFKKELKARKIDVVLMPFHLQCRLFFPKRYHQHVIVHDLISQNDKIGIFKFFYHKFLLNKVSHYISISEGTRKALKQEEGIDSMVVHNSIPFDFTIQEEQVKCISGSKYILDVNRFQKNKNPQTLIQAFSLVKDKIPHLLYLKGDSYNDTAGIEKLVSDLNMEGRVIIDRNYRSEREMRYLYSHADLFVSPSLKEGFGWTPIEAAILKVPVLVSDIEVLREVTCNRLPLFNPHSPEELARKMVDILNNPPSMEAREESAKFYLEKYSLQNQINLLTEVLLQGCKE